MILDDIATILIAAGAATATMTFTSAGKYSAGDLARGQVPEEPDNCVMVFEYPGLETVRASATGPGQALAERPRVQVLVRNKSYDAARTTMNTAYKALDHYTGTPNSTLIHYIHALDTPQDVSHDTGHPSGAKRTTLSCNFQVIKELS